MHLMKGGAIIALVVVKFGRALEPFWHQRLGHPHSKLVQNLASKQIINVCSSCQMGKSCHRPFFA